MWRPPPAAAAGIALAVLAATPLGAQELVYSGSLQFATGDYIFSERTNSVLFFNGLAASAGRLRISANVPVIMQSTPWVSYAGGGAVPSGGTQSGDMQGGMRGRMGRGGSIALADTASYDEVGLGDPLAYADLEIISGRGLIPTLRIAGHLKVPIADVERGFGTGEWDYGAGLSLTSVFGSVMLFADIAYWVLGDMPDLELENPVSYSLGLGLPIGGGRWGLLTSLSGYSEIIAGADPPAQLSVGASYLMRSGRSLLASAAFGLSESTPDLSFSFGWRVPL